MSFYLLKPCKTATAFITTLKRPRRFDLEDVRGRLERAGHRVTDVKVMLILEGDPEMTLYESGKVLVKTDDEAEARSAVSRVYDTIGVAEAVATAR